PLGFASQLHAIVGAQRTVAHELHRVPGPALQVVDHAGDFVRGVLYPLGQVAHLVGDHGEAATLFAGAGGFDGGVERQQVGLFGDAVDHVDHATDLFAVHRQPFDHLRGFLNTV